MILITAPGAGAKGTPLPCTYSLPPETYVVNAGRLGVLAYQPITSNKSWSGFACRLYRSQSLGTEFFPITTFSSVNAIFTGPSAAGVKNSTGATVFIWAQKKGESRFALYATADTGIIWRQVPETEAVSARPLYIVVPDILASQKAFVLPVSSDGTSVSLHRFWETRNGGLSWHERSLPGDVPSADGLLFDPTDCRRIWVWRGSMGDWTGVRYSGNGGVTWHFVEVPAENHIYGAVLNPFTEELLVTGRQVISRWYKGKGEDLRGRCGLSSTDFVAGPPLLNVTEKEVLVPVVSWKKTGGVKGTIYTVGAGKVKRVTDFVTNAEPVYTWVSDRKFYLSCVGVKKPGEILVFSLPGPVPKRWSIPTLLSCIAFLVMFLLVVWVRKRHDA